MLIVRDLVTGYRGSPVAALPSFALAGGQTALLLGRSGSGKTTLLLAIAGIGEILGGAVRVDGQDIASLSTSARDRFRGRSIGLVFQDIHLLGGLTTLDNVLLAPFAAGVRQDRPRALRLLAELGLADKTHHRALTLSRGQAQRAAIARAMLLAPKLILADEPTASLDDETCLTVFELLARAARETGAALLVATHDRRLKHLADLSVEVRPAT